MVINISFGSSAISRAGRSAAFRPLIAEGSAFLGKHHFY